jgi:hypothetical protein
MNCGGFIASITNASTSPVSSTAENAFTTTAATDQTYTLPADFCQPGKVIKIVGEGYYGVVSATTSTVIFRVRLDTASGTLLGASQTATSGSGVTNQGFHYQLQVACKTAGSSGTVDSQGWGWVSTTGNTTITQGPMWATTPPADITVNTTATHLIVPTVQFGTSGATNQATLRQFTVVASGP